MIREAVESDLAGLLRLYTQLHGNSMPADTAALRALWQRIMSDPGHHIIVAEENGTLAASCVLVVVPNLTHGQRPYALVENMITHPDFRRRGLATACLDSARSIAVHEDCYKIMLMTGSKEQSTLRFYEQAGYNRTDKTAFIQWL
jgi:ribosomal protein S18 acetylase RimI-like enzyme